MGSVNRAIRGIDDALRSLLKVFDEIGLRTRPAHSRSASKPVSATADLSGRSLLQTCHQLVTWLTNHPITAGHLHALHRVECDAVQRIRQTATDLAGQVGRTIPGSDQRRALTNTPQCAWKSLRRSPPSEFAPTRNMRPFSSSASVRSTGNSTEAGRGATNGPSNVAVDGLFEYIDEQLNARNVLLALLRKYKQRCEWFHKSRLVKAGAEGLEGRSGERALVLDLHEYLVDQGVEFFVEPSSSSGEADLILRDANGRYIVVDAKHLKPEDSVAEVRRKLAFGFHQVVRYCEDYNESAGYLVGFDESPC